MDRLDPDGARSMVRGCAFVIIGLLAGCDALFGLDPVPVSMPDAGRPFSYCDPQPADLYRYALASGTETYSDVVAQQACRARAMDLLVINDEAERAFLDTSFKPTWGNGGIFMIGATDVAQPNVWVSSDGCPMIEFFLAGENTPGNTFENCAGLTPAFGMVDGACSGGFGAPIHAAACETPRYPTASCFEAARVPQMVFAPMGTTLVTYDDARAICADHDARLLEINSSAELDKARAVVNTKIWAGAVWQNKDGVDQWVSETGCPLLLPFGPSQPIIGTPPQCVMIEVSGLATVTKGTSPTAAAVCEK